MSSESPDGRPEDPGVTIRLDALLAERGMTLTELSRATGITMANLSILKTNKARAIRLTTIAAICRELSISPGELFALEPGCMR